MHTMILWLVAAMTAWTHGRGPERQMELEAVASDIVTVAYDSAEPALYQGEQGRAKTALLLAAIAAMESGYRSEIQRGRCKEWECDRGHAYCYMQIHPERGIVLDGEGWGYAQSGTPLRVYLGGDLTASPEACFRVGLHMVRASLRATKTLRAYTGEWGEEAPKAEHRLRLAMLYWSRHPAPMMDVDVVEQPVAQR